MPHLSDDSAAGATSSTSVRSSSRMERRYAGCLARKPSIGAPKSARVANFLATGFLAIARAFVFVALEAFFGFRAFFSAVFMPQDGTPRRGKHPLVLQL